jgi:hypothetical protein
MDLKLWWFALQKPVKEHDKRVWDSFDVITKWLISTRATERLTPDSAWLAP